MLWENTVVLIAGREKQERLRGDKMATCKGANKMQKLLFGILLLVLVLVFPFPARAGVHVGINFSLPLPIVFVAPPEMVVLPETNVYVVPGVEEEIFFYDGWWRRPWEGRWYRSRDYNSGWSYYRRVPSFYRHIPSGWRNDYREHQWRGHQWNYRQIPHQQVQQNWRGWKDSGHWNKQQNWGGEGLQPRRQSQQPSRSVRPRQSQPQLQNVESVRSGQRREVAPQSRESVRPQHQEVESQSRKGQSQQHQNKHGRGEEEKQN